MCQCPTGWKGDGKKSCFSPEEPICTDQEKICGKNGLCLTAGAQAICHCADGYRWNSDSSECEGINQGLSAHFQLDIIMQK